MKLGNPCLRLLKLVLCVVILFGGLWLSQRILTPFQASAITIGGEASGGSCKIIGNNSAVRFADSGILFSEAPTLAIVTDTGLGNLERVVTAVTNSPQPVIIRLGGGEAIEQQPSATQWATFLTQVYNQVQQRSPGKKVYATAGHNEPNCAEFNPLAAEQRYVQTVAANVPADIELITGQLDFYCGNQTDQEKATYINTLANIAGIDGVALPFYIGPDLADKQTSLRLLNQAISNSAGKPIYITESGPYVKGTSEPSREHFLEYAQGIAELTSQSNSLNIQQILLFNSLGINKQADFNYTAPFHTSSCRVALRSQCADAEAVTAACVDGIVDQNDFFLYPIEGLSEQNPDVILNSLIDQGYQAMCTSPTFDINAAFGGDVEEFKEYLTTNNIANTGQFTTELEANLVFDYASVRVPLWRNDAGTGLLSSLENYFSYRDLEEEYDPTRASTSAPVYALLSPVEQCQAQIDVLQEIDRRCAGDPACAMYIPLQTGDNLQNLWGKVQSQVDVSRPDQVVQFCREVATDRNGSVSDDIRQGLKETPLYFPNAYRLAFLVLSTRQENQPAPLTAPFAKFNFISSLRGQQPPGEYIEPHNVRVIAFRVPDTGTNRNVDSLDNSFTGLEITSDITIGRTQKGNFFERYRQDREVYREQLLGLKEEIEAGNFDTYSFEVGCIEGQPCNTPLISILNLMINGAAKLESNNTFWLDNSFCNANPDDLRDEPVNEIGTSGSIKVDEAQLDNQASQTLESLEDLFVDDNTGPDSVSPFEFLSRVDLNPFNEGNTQTQTKVYLVAPYGYDLTLMQKSIAGLINASDLVNDPNTAILLPLQNVSQTVEATSFRYQFNRQANSNDALAQYNQCLQSGQTNEECSAILRQQKEVEVKITETEDGTGSDNQARIPGAFLGQLTKLFYLSNLDFRLPLWDYVQSCETTEDFFLNRCGTNQVASQQPNSGDAGYVNERVAQCTRGVSMTAGAQPNQSLLGTNECTIAYSTSAVGAGSTAQGNPVDSNGQPFYPVLIDRIEFSDLAANWRNPNDDISCDEALFSQAACTFQRQDQVILLAHLVDDQGNFTPNGSQTACEYVRQQAIAAGISPRLAIALWGEESGFSSYVTAGTQSFDFGVVSTANSRDSLSIANQAQIAINSLASSRYSSIREFFFGYSGEPAIHVNRGELCRNPNFPINVNELYQGICAVGANCSR